LNKQILDIWINVIFFVIFCCFLFEIYFLEIYKYIVFVLFFGFKMTNKDETKIEDQRWERLDKDKFQTFFDPDGRLVKEHEFRKAVFKGEK